MPKNIVETVRDTGTFTTLLLAISRAGLERKLTADGPYTVFAPSDDAFADLPEGTIDALLAQPEPLSSILSYHLVRGRFTVAQAARVRRARTIHGEDLWLSVNGDVHVDGACLLDADIEASNGLIHAIDRVLLPVQI